MGWYEALKDVLTLADRLKDAELKQRLADVQMEGAKLAEENARLRQELIDLRQQVDTRQQMEFRDNVYWRLSLQGKGEGPFCPKCLDGDGKAARMVDAPNHWECPVCDFTTRKPGSDPGPTGHGQTKYF
jgi:hypothetical protein